MSDSLKDRLNSHSNSFEGLLSLIPARYYYEDENNSQWKKKHGHINAEERKAEIAQKKQKKFDPDVGSSALDEIKRREMAADNVQQVDQQDNDAETSDEDVIVYDLNGNVLGDDKEPTVAELLQAKAQDSTAESANHETNGIPEATQAKDPDPPVTQQPKTAAKEHGGKSSDKPSATLNKIESVKSSKSPQAEKNRLDTQQPKLKAGVEELKAKLSARVQELRAIRKAPGSDAIGAPKNREELLAARKKRQELKSSQGLKRSAEESDNESEVEDDQSLVSDVSTAPDSESSLIYGQIQFSDGTRLGKSGYEIEKQRNVKKRNAIDQLKVLENRKNKILKLDFEKQKQIAENAQWSRAILQSEGAKVRDDESLLRKTIKHNQNQKKRSEKEWKQRVYNVMKGISDREAKRDKNIQARKEAKKMRLKGKKRKQFMKSAGAQ